MSGSKLAVKSSFIGLFSQLAGLAVKLLVRTFLIRYFGKEILGLDGVLIDIIGMLSLAELGVTSVLIFRLYEPIINKDTQQIIKLMAVYRRIYRIIAIVVFAVGMVLSLALKVIVTGVSIPWNAVFIAYYVLLVNSVTSYLLSYKRILLNADQKKHICMFVDTVVLILFSGIKILCLIFIQSYIVYLVVSVAQTIVSNIYLSHFTNKHYKNISFTKSEIDKKYFKLIITDTKEVIGNKLAGYVYMSTDNLLVSIFLGTGVVGLLTNYKFISTAIKNLVGNALSAMQPIIGNYLNKNNDRDIAFIVLQRYTFIRYIIALLTVVPFVALADMFVFIWTGSSEYLMPISITILLAVDYYIGCVYGPLNEYLMGVGMFKQGKYAMFSGAITNIIFSLVGVMIWGIQGILFATVISQFVIWIFDIIIVFKHFFPERNYLQQYIVSHLQYFAVLTINLIGIIVCLKLYQLDFNLISFLLLGIVLEVALIGEIVLLFRNRQEFKYCILLVKQVLCRKKV